MTGRAEGTKYNAQDANTGWWQVIEKKFGRHRLLVSRSPRSSAISASSYDLVSFSPPLTIILALAFGHP